MTSLEPRVSRRAGLLLIAAAALGALLLYRPHTAAPFEIVDFSETLPILTAGDGFLERFRRLFEYYVGHGRAAIGLSAGLAAKWTLFEWWTPGWQWTRYLVGLGVVVLAWRLLRRLGASRAGAAAGASLFIVAEAAAPGWLRPAVSEPFGTLVLLGAALVACRYQSSAKPLRVALVVAALCMLLILTKETLIATALLPVALALCLDTNGLLTWPRWTRRNLTLLLVVGVGVAIASVPTLWAVTQATAEGYARQFGSTTGLVGKAIFGVLPALVPFLPPVAPAPPWLLVLAALAWLAVLLMGWRTLPQPGAERRHVAVILVLTALLSLARVAVYLPWPLDYPYYSIPYLLSAALLLAFALTLLRAAPREARIAGVVAAWFVVAFGATGASANASRYFASRRLSDSLVAELHAAGRSRMIDSIHVAVAALPAQPWWGLGPTLARFGAATAREIPPTRDVLCSTIQDGFADVPPRTAVVSLRWQCSIAARADTTIQVSWRRLDLQRLRLTHDTLSADIALPRIDERRGLDAAISPAPPPAEVVPPPARQIP